MKSNKEVMFKKAIDVLEECKPSPSKKDAEDAFGKHVTHQLRSFSQRQQYFLHFRIEELIYQLQEQQSSRENYGRPHFPSAANFEAPSPQFNLQMNMRNMNETRSLTNSEVSFSNNSEFTHMLNNSFR